MGGNASAIDRGTGEIKVFNGRLAIAERISIGFDTLIFRIQRTLEKLNDEFFNQTKNLLWEDPLELIRKGGAFNGSLSNYYDSSIKLEEFITYKPSIGDIDVTIPKEKLQLLFGFLSRNEGKKFDDLTYIGHGKKQSFGSQISTIFYADHTKRFIQIDFEGTEYINGKPSPFAKFAHSSPWVDMKKGIKGIAHKYLLMMLAWTAESFDVQEKIENVVVLTDKSKIWPLAEVRKKKLHRHPYFMSFSVDKGLRWRLEMQKYNGVPVRVCNDKIAYKELSTSKSKYETNLNEIFYKLFHFYPTIEDLGEMQSFLGLLELCEKYVPQSRIENIFDQLVRYKLFGAGQALSRNSSEEDKEVKVKIVSMMMARFPYLIRQDKLVANLMKEYYISYKEREQNV